ncbi:MAG TPA: methyltransferase domain-containing protein [Egibacteraceae bacterium]|nr:methyltransferase domain-containing protein [Egibacteraceae bacterium]
MHEAAAIGFQRSAEAYERGRPAYPQVAVQWLVDLLDLRPGRLVVDLAAGTGKLTRMLVPTGATVVPVEPVLGMCSVLAEAVPDVPIVAGAAEQLPVADAGVDVVTVAQAFHWFDGSRALAEVHRVLSPGGWLALVWNRRDLQDPVHQEISRIIDPYRGDTPSHHCEHWRRPLQETRLFNRPQEVAFANEQVLDVNGLVDRVMSTSFLAALSTGKQQAVVASLRALAVRHEGSVVLPYRTEIQAFARSS